MRPTIREYILGAICGAIFGGVLCVCVDQATQQRDWAEAMQPQPVPQIVTPRLGAPRPMTASYYGTAYHGRITSSGERFDKHALTAAHRALPFGTRLLVSHRGRSVEVRVTDRGPLAWTGKDLDLSEAAFAALAPLHIGVLEVEVREVLQ